jgi:hypothetical protein
MSAVGIETRYTVFVTFQYPRAPTILPNANRLVAVREKKKEEEEKENEDR